VLPPIDIISSSPTVTVNPDAAVVPLPLKSNVAVVHSHPAAAATPLDEYGRSHLGACRTRRRVKRTGMLDMWVLLSHPTVNAGGNVDGVVDGGGEREMLGKAQ
jgi:hypothetical protein